MVLIPAGTLMRRKPVHIRTPFLIGKYPVTCGQFAAFVQASCYVQDGDDIGKWRKGRRRSDDHPVTFVNYGDAVAYCEWLSRKTHQAYRLPSELEWEYAARAGTTTAYYWGDDIENAARYAHLGLDYNFRQMATVYGRRLPNQFGLYDMLGSVREWCAGNEVRHVRYDPQHDENYREDSTYHIAKLKGGHDTRRLSVDFTDNSNSSVRHSEFGFRLCRNLS